VLLVLRAQALAPTPKPSSAAAARPPLSERCARVADEFQVQQSALLALEVSLATFSGQAKIQD
jgi:hypothetical protein